MARFVQQAAPEDLPADRDATPWTDGAMRYWQNPVAVLHVPPQHCEFVVQPCPEAWQEFEPQKSARH